MRKLTEAQMIAIIDSKTISQCTKNERDQVFAYAFGGEFMESKDKGTIKTYKS